MTLPSISEGEFQEMVMDLAKARKWRVAHIHDSRRQVKTKDGYRLVGDQAVAGFPDLVLVRPPRLIFAELKRNNGKVTGVQREWLTDLRGSSAEVYLWQPKDWDDVIKVLV